MVKDQISDFITKLRNANASKKQSMVFEDNKIINSLADILLKEGYISLVSKKREKNKDMIEMTLQGEGKKRDINGIERISKLSRRVYHSSKRPINKYGSVILSTSKGIMTERMAHKARIGGEAFFLIW